MNRKSKRPKNQRLRQLLIREAARLMYEEGVSEYLRAKRIAAKRLFGAGGQQKLRFRPQDLPSNGEIREALLQHAELVEGAERIDRLFAMRVIALETMQDLEAFHPALIGSVSTGHVRRGSDIDLHVFAEDIESLENHIHQLGWTYERSEVLIRKGGRFQEYTHIHLHRSFAIELSVYEPNERRIWQRSSTDGKPITRVKTTQLQSILQDEHPQAYQHYLQTGHIPNLETLEHDDQTPTLASLYDGSWPPPCDH